MKKQVLVAFSYDFLVIAGGHRAETLQKVDVPIMENEECQQWFVDAKKKLVIVDTCMCAGFENGGKDSCQVSSISTNRLYNGNCHSLNRSTDDTHKCALIEHTYIDVFFLFVVGRHAGRQRWTFDGEERRSSVGRRCRVGWNRLRSSQTAWSLHPSQQLHRLDLRNHRLKNIFLTPSLPYLRHQR